MDKYVEIHFLVRVHELLNMADDVVSGRMELSPFQKEWFKNELIDVQSQCRTRLGV